MSRKYLYILVCIVLSLSVLGCSIIRGGARDGVRDGVAGMFTGGGSGGAAGGGDYGGSGDTADRPERNYSGEVQSVPWPSDSTWNRYSLSGLKQPSGTTVTGAALYYGQYIVAMINGGKAACEELVSQIDGRVGAELVTDLTTTEGDMKGYQLSGSTIQISCDYVSGDIAINITK